MSSFSFPLRRTRSLDALPRVQPPRLLEDAFDIRGMFKAMQDELNELKKKVRIQGEYIIDLESRMQIQEDIADKAAMDAADPPFNPHNPHVDIPDDMPAEDMNEDPEENPEEDPEEEEPEEVPEEEPEEDPEEEPAEAIILSSDSEAESEAESDVTMGD